MDGCDFRALHLQYVSFALFVNCWWHYSYIPTYFPATSLSCCLWRVKDVLTVSMTVIKRREWESVLQSKCVPFSSAFHKFTSMAWIFAFVESQGSLKLSLKRFSVQKGNEKSMTEDSEKRGNGKWWKGMTEKSDFDIYRRNRDLLAEIAMEIRLIWCWREERVRRKWFWGRQK